MGARLEFRQYRIEPQVSLSALLDESAKRCGIYVLRFNDGQEYVGQTRDLPSRFAAHRRRQPGTIVELEFAEVGADGLDQAERLTIQERERAGVRLRNIDLVGLPQSGEALGRVVSPVDQEDWLVGQPQASEVGARAINPDRYEGGLSNYAALSQRSDYRAILEAFTLYVANVIPQPASTEGRFWVLSAYPTTGKSKLWHRVAVLTAQNVEVLVFGEGREQDDEPWSPVWFMNVSAGVRLPRRLLPDSESTDSYAGVGPVVRIWGDEPIEANDAVVKAARRLCVGLMRKGPSMMSRFHNYRFADDIFGRLQA